MLRKILLWCGILSSALYVCMCITTAAKLPGYSSFSQTVSELSAVGTVTRPLWMTMSIFYGLFFTAFACGVLLSANANRPLKIAGIFLAAYSLLGFAWPPMHQREVLAAGGKTLTDIMHLVFTAATVVIMVTAMGFGAMAFGKRFRYYSFITIAVLFAFGCLTGMGAANVEANLPTPWIGVWERINIGVFLLWVIVLAIMLLQQQQRSIGGAVKAG